MPKAAGGIKRGDLSPPFEATLEDYNPVTEKWEPADLTGTSELKVWFRATEKSNLVIEGEAQVVGDPKEGKVKYQWALGDTAVADHYQGEVKLLRGGKPESYPRVGYFDFDIDPNLGEAE